MVTAEAIVGVKELQGDLRPIVGKGGAAVTAVQQQFPGVVKQGVIDRRLLGEIVFKDSEKRKRLEQLLHPKVIVAEDRFIHEQRRKDAKILVLDIPLLFETGGESRCDFTIVASAPPSLISTPRPAMFVEIVTAPGNPA